MQLWAQGDPIILVRKQFQQLLNHSAEHEPLRNQLIIDFPTQMGLRTKEIRMAFWEDVDVDSGHLFIRNSKSKHLYPLPLTYTIAQKLDQYRSPSDRRGVILRRLFGCSYSHQMKGQPISNKTVWDTWHRVARRAGVQHPEIYTPRLGRHYFAAMFTLHPDPRKRGSLEVLRRILRHKTLTYTQIYLSRLIFVEDIKREFNRIRQIPQIGGDVKSLYNQELEQVEVREECLSCPACPVCKHKYELARCEAASGCKFRPKILERAKT